MHTEELAQIRAIEQLKYRYMRAVDTKNWTLLESTLHPDVTASYGTRLSFDNRDDLVAMLSRVSDHRRITVHELHHPEIAVDGDTATGTWLLTDRVIRTEARAMIMGAAHYSDEYRRGADGAWLISRTSYERIYESVMSLDDVPSYVLTANLHGHPMAPA